MLQVGLLHVSGVHRFTIPENGISVADLLTFLEEMADVDHADPCILEFPNHLEKIFHVHPSQAAGWLIHDENLGLAEQRSGNFHDLLLCNTELMNGCRKRECAMIEHFQGTSGDFGLLMDTPATPATGFAPQCDILHDRKIRGEIQLLIDHGDPGHAGVMWVFRMEGAPSGECFQRPVHAPH